MFEILVVLALVAANGLFAGAEIAVLTVRRTRIAELVEEERAGAAALSALRADPESFLATVQIGITVVGAAAAAFGGATLAAPLAAGFGALGVPVEVADDVALGLVVVVVSFLSLVAGELVPKSLAMRFAEGYALAIARPLSLLARLGRPVVRFLTACSNLILRLFGDRTSFTEARLSREELQTLVEETAMTGALDPRGLKVGTVMTPRTAVVAIPVTAGPREIQDLFSRSPFERFPVHEGSLDTARGYVLGRDVLLRLLEGSPGPLEGLVHEAPFFPESAEAVAVLRDLQKLHVSMGFVVDELGAFTGLVTFEDLVEEVVGEILHEKATAAVPYRSEGEAIWAVEGGAGVRDVNRALDLELPEDPAYATIAGLVLHRLGRIPRPGESLVDQESGLKIEVVESTARHVSRVRLTRVG